MTLTHLTAGSIIQRFIHITRLRQVIYLEKNNNLKKNVLRIHKFFLVRLNVLDLSSVSPLQSSNFSIQKNNLLCAHTKVVLYESSDYQLFVIL